MSSKKRKRKQSDNSIVPVRGPGGSTFVKCEDCGKHVHAALAENHKNECANHKATSKAPQELRKQGSKSNEPSSKSPRLTEKVESSAVEVSKSTYHSSVIDSPSKVQQDATEKSETEHGPQNIKSSSQDEQILQSMKNNQWYKLLASEFEKPYFHKLLKELDKEKEQGYQIFPPENEIFNAFQLCPWDNLKAVIIGQDPYHDEGQAHGLSFSVRKGVKIPPSLRNIYKELSEDIPGFVPPSHGNLEQWAKNGILLLNTILTVKKHIPKSHFNIGWTTFTDAVIKLISEQKEGVVFILWGASAQAKATLVNRSKHHILKAAHPSPLAGNKFLGCKVFSKTNRLLTENGKDPIDWNIPDQ